MPFEWNNILVVTKEELVPRFFTWNSLRTQIDRHAEKSYGIKRAQLGGNGRQMLIHFDSLPIEIQNHLGDPRKLTNVFERYYLMDKNAVEFYSNYTFEDGSYLNLAHQNKYVINANVLNAFIHLRNERKTTRDLKAGKPANILSSLLTDLASFNKVLMLKHNVSHNLPENERRFSETLKKYELNGYSALISKKHKNANSRKVNDNTIELLNNLFGSDPYKPTATDIYNRYNSFLANHLVIINNNTGEIYNPHDFKSLSDTTVKNYINSWQNRIGTHALRSGNRQEYMQKYKPYHSLVQPKFAGSIISIDDRQPPFKTLDGNRIWFYNGIDLASEAFVCWVYGNTKEGIILEFYRQLIRNYAEWGFNLPDGLEAESSLNSSYTETFLKDGVMFQNVRIEANNARGKKIESYYKPLRYQLEKKREGWLARPFALSESNQIGSKEAKALPYKEIVKGCLQDIETWNNTPHSKNKNLTRWEYHTQMQNPNLKPTNYKSILPLLGFKTETSCNVGIIKLNNGEFLLGQDNMVALGDKLISLMNLVEGKKITVYWLDDNHSNVLKAVIYLDDKYICEAIAKPTYNRAKIEQTEDDLINYQIMSSYVSTIQAFGKRKTSTIDTVTIIDNTPKPKKTFIISDLSNDKNERKTGEILPNIAFDDKEDQSGYSAYKPLRDRF